MTRGMVLPSHAAEKHKGTREVLKHVSGLNDDTIYRDAASPQAGEAERMHTYMISPECNAFSRRRHGRDATTMAAGAANTAAVMPYVMVARADVVVVENVDEPDGWIPRTSASPYVDPAVVLSESCDERLHRGGCKCTCDTHIHRPVRV